MQRRTLIRGAGTSAFLSFLTACGGGSEDIDTPGDPDIGHDADGYEHVTNLDTLPPSQPLDTAWMAQAPFSSQPYSVRVAIGSQAQAQVPVRIMDIHGNAIAEGRTDDQGRLTPSQSPRRFMVALAETTQGTLYGFEVNHGALYLPVIEVNLIGTLIYKLQRRMNLGQDALEFLITSFLNLEYDSDLLAEDSWELDQEAMRLEAQAMGLTVDAYLDQAVQEILTIISESDSQEPPPLAKSLQRRRTGLAEGLQLKESGRCPVEFTYDSRLDENIPDELKQFVRDNWGKAAKALLGAAFKKIGEAYGIPGMGEASNLVLGKLLPEEDPMLRALGELEVRLSTISRVTNELLEELKQQEHRRLLDTVIGGFNEMKAIFTGIAERRKLGRSGPAQEELYNKYMLTQCQKLIAQNDKLTALFDLFLGSALVGTQNVIYRWHVVYQNRKYYTATIERRYNDLLDWYQLWNTTVYNYMADAHTTLATLSGQPLDTQHLALMRTKLKEQTLALEKLRPRKLPSSRLFFDVANQLAWVGGCQKVSKDNYLDLVPFGKTFNKGNFGRGRLDVQRRMRMPDTSPCPQWVTRMAGTGISDELFDEFNRWTLPSKKNIEDSFASFIKKDYLDLFGGNRKTFNWKSFADHCLISSTVSFLDGDKPIKVLLSNSIETEYHWFLRYWSLNGSHFDLQNLKSSGFHFAEQDIRADKPKSYLKDDYVIFPVQLLKAPQLDPYLPWKVYQKQRG